MTGNRIREALILGVLLCLGLALLGHFTAGGIVALRALDRTVTVKGLAEREVSADVVIWPVKFAVPGNDLGRVTADLEQSTQLRVEIAKAVAAGKSVEDVVAGKPTTAFDSQWGGGFVKPDDFVRTVYRSLAP